MALNNRQDVIIIGGSYSGLSAAMALGRSLRNVLIIDGGKPCNRQTPHSHNFITHDGDKPAAIAAEAKKQVLAYETVNFINDVVEDGKKTDDGFEITTAANGTFTARKLIFASGIKDIMPEIEGFAECWGITAIHCPYCHGYEVRGEVTGILADGDAAMHFAPMISNLTKELTVFTNGKSMLTDEQRGKLRNNNISVVEDEIKQFDHEKGYLKNIVFKSGSRFPVKAVYARLSFVQNSDIPEKLGCKKNEPGLLEVDFMQRTNIPGVFAVGDTTVAMRSVANAVATGSMAGAAVNNELCAEDFNASVPSSAK